MILTGKEIQNITTTEGTGIISRKDGRACLEYTAPNGTKFQYTGPNSTDSVACCNALLEELLEVGNECVILNKEENQQEEVYRLYIPLKSYWNLRRSVFARQTAANRVINVDGYPCSLLGKDDYYSTELMSQIEHELQERSLAPMYAGVYGIYDGDDLLYVGSATCLIERWKEHNQNFRTKSFSSKLYSAEVDPDQLIYKELISGTEIAQTCGLAYTSTWLLEFAEWMYIRTLQPKYNINGKIKQFQFHPNVKKSGELMSHLEDGRNVDKTTAQPRSIERTTTPQSKQSKPSPSKTPQSTPTSSQPKPSTPTNPADLLTYCLASATETSDLPPLSSNLLAQSDQKLAFLPSIRRPKRPIGFPLCEETRKRYFSMNLLANQNENNFSVSPDDIDLIRVNVIDPYTLFQPESSPYYLSTETFFIWQLICEHLARQDKYTASIPASWLTKTQLKELVSRQYLTPDSDMTLRLNRNYIIKQLSLKKAKEQYPQQYERSI